MPVLIAQTGRFLHPGYCNELLGKPILNREANELRLSIELLHNILSGASTSAVPFSIKELFQIHLHSILVIAAPVKQIQIVLVNSTTSNTSKATSAQVPTGTMEGSRDCKSVSGCSKTHMRSVNRGWSALATSCLLFFFVFWAQCHLPSGGRSEDSLSFKCCTSLVDQELGPQRDLHICLVNWLVIILNTFCKLFSLVEF